MSFVCLSQNTFVPDDNFEQALIDLGFDSGPLDDFVPSANISGLTNLDVSNKNILDLTGIEDFIALSILNCDNNQLSNLDITKNINLTQLYCGFNQLTTIDTTQNTLLNILWCQNNIILDIDITNNLNIISLVCSNNQLTSLDVTNNSTLNVLVFENNQISSINTSNNNTLNFLNCKDNLLTSLDITQNINLNYLDCSSNQINALSTLNNTNLSFLNASFNNLQRLDLSQNSLLKEIDCSNNELCQLNIKNAKNKDITAFNFINNSDLNCVVVDNISEDHSAWMPSYFANYATSINDCSNFINVDSLSDFIGASYTLPILTHGNYFTKPNGQGVILNAGDSITSSQTIYIYAETACASNESSFNIIISEIDFYIPKYFTPNNDGNHDTWVIQDTSNTIKIISIFDHYGKLLKSLTPNSQGWNGIYNGTLMETNDYWYVITLTSGKTFKGHFTLKR